ncbi:MAG: EboA domain-containing protein [Planctomycetota bacterium]
MTPSPSLTFALASSLFEAQLPADRQPTWADFRAKAVDGGLGWLEVHFAATLRKIGREALTGGLIQNDQAAIIAESFRLCDLAAPLLFDAAGIANDGDAIFRLYERGDHEERRMILKALTLLPVMPVSIRLLQEAHRTNDGNIFIAAFADTDLPARALDDDDFARGILKAAFTDLSLDRILGASKRATPELSRMLLDFMSEREAAHRPVWAGSIELAAFAPCPGVLAKVTGDLWSGVDARRLAAIRAAKTLNDPRFESEFEARRQIEPHLPIRKALN